MLYKKKGYPEEGDIVLCTVMEIQGNSVFVKMDEYNNLSGMIHISEISPGRIRNIRDFVREGKVVYCKVLKTYLDRGHFDLSLRRVGEGLKREKANEIKQELKAEKIIEFAAQKLKAPIEKIYSIIAEKVLSKYPYIYSYFEAVSKDSEDINNLGIDKKLSQELKELIMQRITPKKIVMGGKFKVKVFTEDGIDIIKNIFKSIENENTDIKYLGAGNYSLRITGEDPKESEKALKDYVEKVTEAIEKKKGQASFVREEIKVESD